MIFTKILYFIYFIYVQYKQTNIINTKIINLNSKLIQIQNKNDYKVYITVLGFGQKFSKKLVKDHLQESTLNYVK